ncbi:MAG: hemerythrin domain-containing protein, partial [Gammaproteobacteria bacterium]
MKMPVMDQLHKDHINYSKLLDLLDSYLEEQKAGSDKGYLEMYLIMNYMTRYPDIFHHPYEDIIFEEVIKLDDDFRDEIENLEAEHTKLYEMSRSLLDDLDAVVNEHIVEKSKIQQAAAEYSSALRSHMDMEEARIFPGINERMTETAWNNIADK